MHRVMHHLILHQVLLGGIMHHLIRRLEHRVHIVRLVHVIRHLRLHGVIGWHLLARNAVLASHQLFAVPHQLFLSLNDSLIWHLKVGMRVAHTSVIHALHWHHLRIDQV